MELDWSAIGAVGEAVGAVAVVVTLIYFAQQIRGMKASGYLQAMANTDRAELELRKLSAVYAEVIVRGNTGQELSDAERYQIKNVFEAYTSFAFHYHLVELQEGSQRHIRAMTYAGILLANPAFLDLFRAQTFPSPEWIAFTEAVEAQLQVASAEEDS